MKISLTSIPGGLS
jgi:hypothetical protein